MSRGRIVLVTALAASLLTLGSLGRARSFAASGERLRPPSREHWFGTDDLGRDVFQGVVLGAERSLLVGLGTAALSLALGVVLGVISGYAGGFVDEALTRITEFFQVLPRFFVAIAVLTLWEPSVSLLVAVLGVTSWSGLARLTRAEALGLREREFVVSARAAGASLLTVVVRHLFPSLSRPLAAAAPVVMCQAMLAEAGLSFLGVGSATGVSWGYLLQNAQPFLRDAPWMAVFPGLAMTGTVLLLSFLSLLGRDAVWKVPREW